eukprot:767137-Hanusia_phi.AAC.20
MRASTHDHQQGHNASGASLAQIVPTILMDKIQSFLSQLHIPLSSHESSHLGLANSHPNFSLHVSVDENGASVFVVLLPPSRKWEALIRTDLCPPSSSSRLVEVVIT